MKRQALPSLLWFFVLLLAVGLACNYLTINPTSIPSGEILIVTGSGSVSVSSAESGVVTTNSGAQLEIPNGAVPPAEDGSPGTEEFSLEEGSSAVMELPSEFTQIGPIYQLMPEGVAFGMPVKLTLPIPEDVETEYVLGVATFDDFSGTWQLLPAVVDDQARTVVLELGHGSFYGMFGLSDFIEAGESWEDRNGGWFSILNTHRDGEKVAPFGKPLPASVYYGVCVQKVVYDNPLMVKTWIWNWRPPTDWMIGATALKNEDFRVKRWLPAGTYTLMEMYGIGETNNTDIFYYPEHRYYVRPIGQVYLGPGQEIEFVSPGGDLQLMEAMGFTWSKHPCWMKPMDTIPTPPVEPGDNWSSVEVVNTHRDKVTKTHFGKKLSAGVYYGVCSPGPVYDDDATSAYRVYDNPLAETWNWWPPHNWMMGVTALGDRDASYTYILPAGTYSLSEVYHLTEQENTDRDYVPEGRYFYRPMEAVRLAGGQTVNYTSPALDPGPTGNWGESLTAAGFYEDPTNLCYPYSPMTFTPTPGTPIPELTYDGVEFPLGDKSFADQVVGFNPGSGTGESDGSAAIGPPDGDTGPSVIGAKGDVTLGRGGSITLKFSDNYLIDVEGLDLYVFEYGPAVEPFKVEISKDGSVWIDLGTVSGQPTGLDIHGKVDPDDRFSYVRITDANPYAPRDPTIIGTEAYEGADIESVGAIGAEERPDSDGDGVADDEDGCSVTPLGMGVDEYGCPVGTPDIAATQGAISAQQTSTAVSGASGTGGTGGTGVSTTQPQPPTQTSQNQAGPGFSNFTDNFTDPASGWPVDSSGGSQWWYANDHYYISVGNANTSAVASVGYTLADGYVIASGTVTQDQPHAYYGVVCRFQDASNYYFFEIGLDGYYRIGKLWNGNWSMIGMGAAKYSSAINNGTYKGGYNQIMAHCNSNDLSLYVNDIFVETVYDNTFSSGQIGLSASTGDFPGMIAEFDHIIAEE